MKRKIIVATTAMALLGLSCRTVQLADLKPQHKADRLLPALQPIMDIPSLTSVYSLGSTRTSVQGSTTTAAIDENKLTLAAPDFSSHSVARADRRVLETITLFEREVKDNLTQPVGETKGYITCRVAAADIRASRGWMVAPSIATLFILNVAGFPYFYFKTELELEVEIKDLKGNVLGRYLGRGLHEVPVALYYGYASKLSGSGGSTDHNAARKSNIEAFKMAMNEIKLNIGKDYPALAAKLR